MAVRKELLEILACPKCKAPVTLSEDGEGLVCKACKVVYPVRDDIPIMIVEEAVPLSKWEKGVRKAEKKTQSPA